MTLMFSRPFDELLLTSKGALRFHTVIVGSGYGAAMSALALATRKNKNYENTEILVIERGNEFIPGDFPKTISDLLTRISLHGNDETRTGYADALVDIRVGDNVNVVLGNGLGGGSLVNAGVAVDPDEEVLRILPESNARQWIQRLAPSLKFVRDLLGVRQHPRGHSLPKVRALKKLSNDLKSRHGTEASHLLADIAISFDNEKNNVGIQQEKCNDCGNCFSGCNIGAKNTLAMNAWPLAKDLGVDIVTNGTVDYVLNEPSDKDYPWKLFAYRTTDATRQLVEVRAKRVILSAGTFGSTEILHRSRTKGGLSVASKCLGTKFSLNGDGVAFGFGQKHAVHAYAKVPSAFGIEPKLNEKPGPTIVSIVRVKNKNSRGLIEDATVPQPIARLWAELLSTQAMSHGYVSDKQSAWHEANKTSDPLTVSQSLMDHHQVVLTMGVDVEGSWKLEYKKDQLQIKKQQASDRYDPDAAANWFDNLLSTAHANGGFDGGIYLANPFWKPLSNDFEGVFEGASKFGGTHLCNHPLGGCPMATNAAEGVVNTLGQVFSAENGTAVHQGLYVFDGSILPAALGINPFMTIAALSHHLAVQIDGPSEVESAFSVQKVANAPSFVRRKIGLPVDWPIPALSFVIRERLFFDLRRSNAHGGPNEQLQSPEDTDRLTKLLGFHSHGLVIDVAVHIPDIYYWLENPAQSLAATFTVYHNPQWPCTIDSVDDQCLDRPLVENAVGTVQLFTLDTPSMWGWRAFLALKRFIDMRGKEIWDGGGADRNGMRILHRISGFVRAARQHSHWRHLRYRFEATINERSFEIFGEKRLAYDGTRSRAVCDESNLWTTLANIKLYFRDQESLREACGWFRVDLVHMARNISPLQSTCPAETPQIVMAAASAGFFILRVLIQTHLWSFGAPSYRNFPTPEEVAKRFKLFESPKKILYEEEDDTYEFDVIEARSPGNAAIDCWRLLKASPAGNSKGRKNLPVLLIHGASQSSRLFYTDAIDKNLAGYLLAAGYEVWILDHGLSRSLNRDIPLSLSIDDISTQIASAIRHVYDETKEKRPSDTGILVFSHCVGSVALSMSILSGRLTNHGRSMIDALVLHAIPPWNWPSENNLIRAYIGAFFKDRFFPENISPLPVSSSKTTTQQTVADMLLDRFAFSMPWNSEEHKAHSNRDKDKHHARTICNRMTAFYGYEWLHRNMSRRAHEEFSALMGPIHADSYRQFYFLVKRKCVTNKEGENAFTMGSNFIKHWTFPTNFLHGRLNEVFDAESSRLSAHHLSILRTQTAHKFNARQLSVALTIVDDYGHLDALIGINAWRDVFPHIDDFFTTRQSSVSLEPPKTRSFLAAIVTGPIISRPSAIDGKHYIRLWLETSEFQLASSSCIKFICAGTNLPTRRIRPIASEGMTEEALLFWLDDLECDHVNSEISILVEHNLQLSTSVRFECPRKVNWAGLPWFKRFLSDVVTDDISFIIGSCWYPGSWFDRDMSDRVFKRVRSHIIAGRGIDHLLLAGDQIYAESSAGIFDIAEHRERYQESYRAAFNSEAARWVFGHIPTYFAVDDHEFRDIYPQPRFGEDSQDLYALGRSAAQEAWNFQMHHRKTPSATDSRDNQLWYDFRSSGFDFFVFDTRSERNLREIGTRRIVSEAQQHGFSAWVNQLERNGKPVFLVTGAPLMPVPADELKHPAKARSSDSLRAFPEFVEFIATTLANAESNRPVILLSGDPHYSSMSRFTVADHNGDTIQKFVGIVSSGINVPLPFANDSPEDIDWSENKPSIFRPCNARIQLHLQESILLSISRAHVLKIDVRPADINGWRMIINIVDADEKTLQQSLTISL